MINKLISGNLFKHSVLLNHGRTGARSCTPLGRLVIAAADQLDGPTLLFLDALYLCISSCPLSIRPQSQKRDHLLALLRRYLTAGLRVLHREKSFRRRLRTVLLAHGNPSHVNAIGADVSDPDLCNRVAVSP